MQRVTKRGWRRREERAHAARAVGRSNFLNCCTGVNIVPFASCGSDRSHPLWTGMNAARRAECRLECNERVGVWMGRRCRRPTLRTSGCPQPLADLPLVCVTLNVRSGPWLFVHGIGWRKISKPLCVDVCGVLMHDVGDWVYL